MLVENDMNEKLHIAIAAHIAFAYSRYLRKKRVETGRLDYEVTFEELEDIVFNVLQHRERKEDIEKIKKIKKQIGLGANPWIDGKKENKWTQS